MKPYYENSLVTLYQGKAEQLLPELPRSSFGCVILDPPVSVRTVEEVDALLDLLGIFNLLRVGGVVYTLANPSAGLFVTMRGPNGGRSQTFSSPLRNCTPRPLHGHYAARPASAIKGLLLSSSGDILDPYCGVGTTLVMAQELKRQAVGIEIEEKFCSVVSRLLSQ